MDDRRHIARQFSVRGLTLSKDALTYLTDQLTTMGSKEQRQRTLAKVMELVEKENAPTGLLNLDFLKEMLKVLARKRRNESEINFKLEDAFEWRRAMDADKARKTLEINNKQTPWEQLGFQTYLQRFELIKELLHDSIDQFATIDSLITHREGRVRILGQLCRGPNPSGVTGSGTFLAEDHTGRVKLDLSSAEFEPGLYFEGGIFVFDGLCSSSADHVLVERVSLPVLRPLAITEGGNGGGGQEMARRKDPNDRIVFMSDVVLDDAKVMQALYRILEGFATNPPNAFVLCGRFLDVQRAHGYTERSGTAFRHLANIIGQFAERYANTHFILVPSAEDPPPLVTFPCPPLPPNVQKCFKDAANFPNVHFTTNPCRLIFKDQHIVIYRDDMVEKLCRSAMHMPRNAGAKSIPKLFCDTIWSQRHFSPLPLFYSPIQAHFDVLFQLWPAPDVLLLADKFKAFVEANSEQRRLTINPGPFSSGNGQFEFQVYFPTLRRVDSSVYTSDEEG